MTAIDLTGIRVTTVSVEYKRKLNLGSYSMADVGETIWADLEEGIDPQDASRKLFAICKAMVREQAMPMIKGFQEKMQKIVATLNADDQEKFAGLFTEPCLELMLGREEQDAD